MARRTDALRAPIALGPNLVPRFYRGGRLLGAFRGEGAADDTDRPEDWVGSATPAWSPPGSAPSPPGLSSVEVAGETMRLDALIRAEPEAMIGTELLRRIGPSPGVLVKLLDAAERLPVHAHPTREAAARLLGSAFGKTEAWLVLGSRDGDAPRRVWAGFREPVARETLRGWIETQDTDALLGSLVEHTAAPGDVFLIPAGTPHAIGAGLFILELQEPTDFSVVAEMRGFPIEPDAASLGLGWDAAIGFFETDASADPRQAPSRVSHGVFSLLHEAAEPYFRALRLELDGEERLPMDPSFAIGVVLAGTGELHGPDGMLPLARGVTFLLPHAAVAGVRLAGSNLDLILCLPPSPSALDRAPLPAAA